MAVGFLAICQRVVERYHGRIIPVPDLFVLDLNLPKNDGVPLLTAIRQSQWLAAVPVIITSSSQ
jgi:DNA-binding response OmpR family regulator